MKYLLDTCVISDFVKGDNNTLLRFKQTPPAHIAISSITLMEIHYGLAYNKERAKKIVTIINDIIRCITILPFTAGDARQAANARAYLRQHGSPIGCYDILIAGAALNNSLVLVTANEKEFSRLAGLTLENWRK